MLKDADGKPIGSIKALFDGIVAGNIKVQVVPSPCKKCGSVDPYKCNPSPNWMNRWTCQSCGRNESR